MPFFSSIYGFEVTKPLRVGMLQIFPVETNSQLAKDLATDRHSLNLTAIAESEQPPTNQLLFDLEAALTFCQQQMVSLSKPIEAVSLAEYKMAIPASLDLPYTRWSHGALIQRDTFGTEPRESFLNNCMGKLMDPAFDERTGYRQALFRNVETWRMNRYVDVTYYLNFSALEILARTSLNDMDSSAAVVLYRFINGLGFDVYQDNPNNPVQSMQTYAHLRNALFHNGEFQKTVNVNNTEVTIRMSDFYSQFTSLLPDVLLKVIGHDDGRINWNRWLDRMPFQ